MRLLVVEDETDLRELLAWSLTEAGYEVMSVGDGKHAWETINQHAFDLVLLDWMLPDTSGIELLKRMRATATHKHTPVIMVTARDDVIDRIKGLDSGADDYVIKPFSMRELIARIRSRLRSSSSVTEQIDVQGLVVEPENFRAHVNGNPVVLGPTEFRLLCHFMRHPDRVFSRSQLLDAVWGTNVYIEERTVDVHIRRLRKALEPFDKATLIQTIRSAGYRLSAEVIQAHG